MRDAVIGGICDAIDYIGRNLGLTRVTHYDTSGSDLRIHVADGDVVLAVGANERRMDPGFARRVAAQLLVLATRAEVHDA